jgi:hypothetical protein
MAYGRRRMHQRLAGMSPHWGVSKGAMGFDRGAPLQEANFLIWILAIWGI